MSIRATPDVVVRRGLVSDAAELAVFAARTFAEAFYRQAGFDEIGLTHYVVGSDRQVDRVFMAALPPVHPVATASSR